MMSHVPILVILFYSLNYLLLDLQSSALFMLEPPSKSSVVHSNIDTFTFHNLNHFYSFNFLLCVVFYIFLI